MRGRSIALLTAGALMAASASSLFSDREMLSKAVPATGVYRPPSKRRKDPNDPKRKKPLKSARQRRRAYRAGIREIDRRRIQTIHQAMRAGGVKVAVQNPEKYLNSHARSMLALKRALEAA